MHSLTTPATCTAFSGHVRIASGALREVAQAVHVHLAAHGDSSVLVLDDITAAPIEFDMRGSLDEVLSRLPDEEAKAKEITGRDEAAAGFGAEAASVPRGPGRPKLGVVAREVTLLPRHWEWLASQPGGASVTLRKLVETARKENADADRVRLARDAAYRFMTTVAGDLPGFEEATRALYAGDRERFGRMVESWAPDVREHAMMLADRSWQPAKGPLKEGGDDAL